MELLVAYDVATGDTEGERRLRRVAQACEGFGQRVQKSVFECTLNAMRREELLIRLLEEMDLGQDSLRVYRLREPRERYTRVFGRQPRYDLRDPLIL